MRPGLAELAGSPRALHHRDRPLILPIVSQRGEVLVWVRSSVNG
jgi:hypothetical protein